ncbi:MAG: tetratricopeptide repeat protein [Calditrichaeota bacterium]|nr:MAG: tetratricopeptide repeat protein [Calditrichota bacterium]
MIDSKINQKAREHTISGLKSYSKIDHSENELKELKKIRWNSDESKSEEIEREIKEIENRMVEPSTGEIKSYDLVNLKKAKEHFTKAIGLDSGNQIALSFRGKCFMKEENYGEATNDFSKVIELVPEDIQALQLVSECLIKMNKYKEACEYLDKAIAIKPENAILFYKRGLCYYWLDKIELAIEDFTQAIELEPENYESYYKRGLCFKSLNKYQNALKDISKSIELYGGNRFSEDFELAEMLKSRSKIYLTLNDYDLAIKDLEKIKYVCHNEYEGNSIGDDIQEIKVQQERDRIMSNLSHSIKNLIASVIDPLENMKRKQTYNPFAIENALKGTNLIREVVNAMNLSHHNSFEDFLYDAKNIDDEGMNFEQVILDALKYSVGNMFDGKYFSNFVENYFPTEEIFIEAKELWVNISQTEDLQKLIGFLQKYFFRLNLNLDEAKEMVIGNAKGSRIKFTILFQELLLNAVKYSSFLPKENRSIKISVLQNSNEITFEVENSFKENQKTKSTGLGLEIIRSFANLLKTAPKIKKENQIYSVGIVFQNLWKVK